MGCFASRTAGNAALTTPLTLAVNTIANALPVGPLEIPVLVLLPSTSATTLLEAVLVSPTVNSVTLVHVPQLVRVDRPLEVAFAADGLLSEALSAATVARAISAHAHIMIVVEAKGRQCASFSVPVSARPTGSGWVARAMVHPAAWADAASITATSLTLSGQLLLSDSLPATLQVLAHHNFFNHSRAPAGAVYAAGDAGDVPALYAALERGASTEEADTVSGEECMGGPRVPDCFLFCCTLLSVL